MDIIFQFAKHRKSCSSVHTKHFLKSIFEKTKAIEIKFGKRFSRSDFYKYQKSEARMALKSSLSTETKKYLSLKIPKMYVQTKRIGTKEKK